MHERFKGSPPRAPSRARSLTRSESWVEVCGVGSREESNVWGATTCHVLP